MKNTEIIFAEVANMIGEENAIEMINEYGELPFHTYAAWKARGYQVQKGSKAVINTKLWKPVKVDEETIKNGEVVTEMKSKMIMVKASLFSIDQVEKIA